MYVAIVLGLIATDLLQSVYIEKRR